MNFIRWMIVLIAVGMMAFYMGYKYGVGKTTLTYAQDITHNQQNLINIKEEINEKVLHTSTDDIRRVLREKYTIAE